MIDPAFMQRAIEWAQRGVNTTTPNPNVGCVIVKDGQVIGQGYHAVAGQAHAEIQALKNVADNGHTPRGASVYVTLEPCSHQGKTPPCADALIAAEVAAVIIGSADPNPQVSGRGVAKLRQAGIQVIENVLKEACDELNHGFFKRMTTGLPWVTVKLGMTLDAKIATADGESQWITGKAARADVQKLRAKSCAVMTSSATVIADNPSLNVRLPHVSRQPKRVIVDSRFVVPETAKVFALDGEVLVYIGCSSPLQKESLSHSPLLQREQLSHSPLLQREQLSHSPLLQREQLSHSPLLQRGARGDLQGQEIKHLSPIENTLGKNPLNPPLEKGEQTQTFGSKTPLPKGEVKYLHVPEKNQHADLTAVLKDLATNQDCNHVLVEAGGQFVGALLDEDLVDELIIYTAPMLLGDGAKSAFAFPAIPKLSDAKHFFVYESGLVGNDIKTVFRQLRK